MILIYLSPLVLPYVQDPSALMNRRVEPSVWIFCAHRPDHQTETATLENATLIHTIKSQEWENDPTPAL